LTKYPKYFSYVGPGFHARPHKTNKKPARHANKKPARHGSRALQHVIVFLFLIFLDGIACGFDCGSRGDRIARRGIFFAVVCEERVRRVCGDVR